MARQLREHVGQVRVCGRPVQSLVEPGGDPVNLVGVGGLLGDQTFQWFDQLSEPVALQRTADLPFIALDSTEHPNALAYRRTADAFRSGNLTLLSSLIDPDVVWHVPGRHAMAGDIHGRDALLAWFGLLRPKGFWLNEHDVFGNDDHVCALSVMGARRDGLEVQTRVVSVFHYRDGRQLERWFYPEDSVAWDTIFGE